MRCENTNKSGSVLTPKWSVILGIACIATVSRLVSPPLFGHPSNIAPITAIALLAGAYSQSWMRAWIIPLAAIFLGDFVVNWIYQGEFTFFYEGFYWQYGMYLVIAAIGTLLKGRVGFGSVLIASLGSSTLFFLVSNFGVWFSTAMYPKTLEGLLLCYTLGIPFFERSIIGDLLYCAVLFGAVEWARARLSLPLRRAFFEAAA